MPSVALPKKVVGGLSGLAGANSEVVTLKSVISSGHAQKGLKWQPDYCIASGDRRTLVHLLASLESGAPEDVVLPRWVDREGRRVQGSFKKTDVLVLAGADEGQGARLASRIAQQCAAARFGLAFRAPGGVYLVFPARYRFRPRSSPSQETGHIPKWVLARLQNLSSVFSPYLAKAVRSFTQDYGSATKGTYAVDPTAETTS